MQKCRTANGACLWIVITVLICSAVSFSACLGNKTGAVEQDSRLTTSDPPDAGATASNKVVVASYYAWYSSKPEMWSDDVIIDHPLVGPYLSSDPNLIDYEVTLARETGINAFSMELYAVGDELDLRIAQIIDRIENSLRYPDFKIALTYSGAASEETPPSIDEIVNSLSHLVRDYGPRGSVLKVQNKPAIFIYNPQTKTLDEWRNIFLRVSQEAGAALYIAQPDSWGPNLQEHLAVFDSISPYADKYVSDEELENYYSQVARLVKPAGKPLVVTVFGGGSRISKLGFDIDRSEGRYIRKRVDLAKAVNADWIQVTSWNEWFESNQVEPSREYGFDQTRYLREALARFENRSLPSLEGARLRREVAGTNVKATNTGTQNLYYITCRRGIEAGIMIAYLLRPAGTKETNLGDVAACQSVTGFLVDGTMVTAE